MENDERDLINHEMKLLYSCQMILQHVTDQNRLSTNLTGKITCPESWHKKEQPLI